MSQLTDLRHPRTRTAGLSTVLREVLDSGPVARSTVARRTGLSPASVTGHTARLIAAGLLFEAPEVVRQPGLGRPHIPLDVDTSRYVVGGVHVAVPHVTTSVVDLRGRVIAQRRDPHRGTDPSTVLSRAADALSDLLSAHAGGRRVLGIGVATGGWVDRESGIVAAHPRLGWTDVPVADVLGARTGLRVQVDSHTRALVQAERLFGRRARWHDAMLTLFVGNVVDAAFSTGEGVHRGPSAQAGTIAHLPVPGDRTPCPCGRLGCLEAAVGEGQLLRTAAERGFGADSIEDLLSIASDGDQRAVALFQERARAVGSVTALLMDMLDPALVVVVEPGLTRVAGCLPALREQVRRHAHVVRDVDRVVVPTSFPETVLATASAAVVLGTVFENPFSPALRTSIHKFN